MTAEMAANLYSPSDEIADPDAPIFIPIGKVKVVDGVRARSGNNKRDVSELRWRLLNQETLPPLVVYYDGTEMILADGFQRLAAYREEKLSTVLCKVIDGSRWDATIYAIKANTAHGRKLTNAEKRSAVAKLLADDGWRLQSDRQIAQLCGCSHPTVAAVRRETDDAGNSSSADVRANASEDNARAAATAAGEGISITSTDADRDVKDTTQAAMAYLKGSRCAATIQPSPPNLPNAPDDRVRQIIETMEEMQNAIGDLDDLTSELIETDNIMLFERYRQLVRWVGPIIDNYEMAKLHFYDRSDGD